MAVETTAPAEPREATPPAGADAGDRSAPGADAGDRSAPGADAGDRSRSARPRPRARKLFRFDRSQGVRWIAGADEAGRGCLAGPLVAAAVLFDYERLRPADCRTLSALNDSKQQTPEAREELFPLVLRIAARTAIVSRCVRAIDERGLHRTNLAALRDALLRVARPGTLCLSDGFRVAGLAHPQRAVIDGDCTSAAIAAASILAKVSRDRYMKRADALHPGWDFAAHVGYSTPEHRRAIEERGISPLHRVSFQSIAYTQLSL